MVGLMLLGFSGFAQNQNAVTGNLIDETTGEALGFATVSLTRDGQSKPAKYTLSDDKGAFSMTSVRNGTYAVVVELMGYEPYSAQIKIENNSSVDLGKIKMKVDREQLEAMVDEFMATHRATWLESSKATDFALLEREARYALSRGMLSVGPAGSYTGSPVVPTVTVKFGDTTLRQGVDYDVAYQDNVNAGIATVLPSRSPLSKKSEARTLTVPVTLIPSLYLSDPRPGSFPFVVYVIYAPSGALPGTASVSVKPSPYSPP